MISDEEDDVVIISSSHPPQSSTVPSYNREPKACLQQYACPFCPIVTEELRVLEAHIEIEHIDTKNPTNPVIDIEKPSSSKLFNCPICSKNFTECSLLESHFHTEHESSLSPETKELQTFSCPVCSLDGFESSDILSLHVQEHFAESDEKLASSLEDREKALMQDQERKEFKRLQSIYGFEKGKNIARQGDANLFRSAQKGQISTADYHEKRIMLKICEKNGIDDGTSVSHDILSCLKRLSEKPGVTSYWCNTIDHYAASVGDSGWGCGYRNLQMMLSALIRHQEYVDKFQSVLPMTSCDPGGPVSIPSITRLQVAIEEAWKLGFDKQGCEQLGGKLSGTCKWIGATEIATLFASCRIRYRLIDFHRPSSSDGKLHPALFEWVQRYFREDSRFKPPLYFQHQGHSRTIIGIEEGKKSSLILLDPSLSREHMRFLMTNVDPSAKSYPAYTKKIWVPMNNLKAKQYQLVCVDSGFIENDLDYEQSKVLRSTRIP